MKPKIERVGIWIRVSTDMQADGDSPEHHLHRAKAYADQMGWAVAEVYRLDGVSGRTVHEHPEMDRMQSDVRSGKIQGLIFSSLTRLARTKQTLWQLSELFREHNAALVCLDMAIDTSNPAGELVYSLFSALAEWEAQLIAERIKASVKTRAKMGKNLGGSAVYGYKWDDGKLTPNPDEAPVRQLIYELYSELQSFNAVANELNRRGYSNRQGKPWKLAAIRLLITDTTAIGKRRANYRISRHKAGQGKYIKPESEWIWLECEPIVSTEIWQKCNDIYIARKARHASKTINIFSGTLMCGECNLKMYPTGGSLKYRCKSCRKWINPDTLESIFKEKTWSFFSPESGDNEREIEQKINNKYKLLKNLERECEAKKLSVQRIDEDYLSGQLNAVNYERFTENLIKSLSKIEAEIASITGDIDALKVQKSSNAELCRKLQSELIRWESFNLEEKRFFIREIVIKMELYQDELVIELAYPYFLTEQM